MADPSVAEAAAVAWARENRGAFGASGSAVSSRAETNASGAILWWSVSLSDGSTVIVSPDTDLEPVVASVSSLENGVIPAGHPLRAMLTKDMERRLAVLAAAKARTQVQTKQKGFAAKSALSLSETQAEEVNASAAAAGVMSVQL